MSKRKLDKIISFESDDDDHHITKEETFEVAHAMYDTLHKVCPGCTMGVLSMLISMLTVHYLAEEAKRGRIFDYEDWYKYIMDGVHSAVVKFEHKDTPIN